MASTGHRQGRNEETRATPDRGAGAGATADARTWNVPSGERIMRWLEDNLPRDWAQRRARTATSASTTSCSMPATRRTLSEYSTGNSRRSSDPLMDVGNLRACWVEDRRRLRVRPGDAASSGPICPAMLSRHAVVDYSVGKTDGFRPDNWAFYEVYAICSNLSAITKQIYSRYQQGLSAQSRVPTTSGCTSTTLHWRCRRASEHKCRCLSSVSCVTARRRSGMRKERCAERARLRAGARASAPAPGARMLPRAFAII